MDNVATKFNERYYTFLDDLDSSGIIGACDPIRRLTKQFNLDTTIARVVLSDWKRTFSKRHSKST